MLSGNQLGRGTGRSEAADWRNRLANDPLLTPGLRESYRRTLTQFDQFCLQRGAGKNAGGGTRAAAQPTVALARDYVELQRLERAPGPAQLLAWNSEPLGDRSAGGGVGPETGAQCAGGAQPAGFVAVDCHTLSPGRPQAPSRRITGQGLHRVRQMRLQCDIKATSKRVDSQPIATPKPPQSHPNATLKPPQGSTKATSKPRVMRDA